MLEFYVGVYVQELVGLCFVPDSNLLGQHIYVNDAIMFHNNYYITLQVTVQTGR